MSRTHKVSGNGGVNLHVVEAGNPNGRSILFVHGVSFSHLAWRKQFESDLADDFRLVAMDLRGHGFSDKPVGAYGDSRIWADDVLAVLTSLELDQPVLCGWSYGGFVLTDYVRYHGESAIAAVNFVSSVPRLGEPLLRGGFMGADFLALMPGTLSEKTDESAASLQAFAQKCVHDTLGPAELAFFLGNLVMTPQHVRLALAMRQEDHDAVLSALRRPVLLTYGDDDVLVRPATGEHMAGLVRHATLSRYPGVGHSALWEAPERFNRELRRLRESVQI
jgi:pimeloyl-ACP methyl ester carboxylesterase